jgi:hypothetical protein
MPSHPVRTLNVPPHHSRTWRLPAILFWLERRREKLVADVGEQYADDSAWRRRFLSIDRKIDVVNRELTDFLCGDEENYHASRTKN